MKYFKREQIHIVDGDALIENPLPELRKIESFLGLKPNSTKLIFISTSAKGFIACEDKGGVNVWVQAKVGPIQKLIAMLFKS